MTEWRNRNGRDDISFLLPRFQPVESPQGPSSAARRRKREGRRRRSSQSESKRTPSRSSISPSPSPLSPPLTPSPLSPSSPTAQEATPTPTLRKCDKLEPETTTGSVSGAADKPVSKTGSEAGSSGVAQSRQSGVGAGETSLTGNKKKRLRKKLTKSYSENAESAGDRPQDDIMPRTQLMNGVQSPTASLSRGKGGTQNSTGPPKLEDSSTLIPASPHFSTIKTAWNQTRPPNQ